jgi:hypothetical protein
VTSTSSRRAPAVAGTCLDRLPLHQPRGKTQATHLATNGLAAITGQEQHFTEGAWPIGVGRQRAA